MIVQDAAPGAPHFVITMDQHTAFAGALAEHFGNERFAAVEPRAPVLHIIGHHDDGWRALDAEMLRDPATGLPYHLVQTPFEHIVRTSKASPDANAATHPYCELLSSMHSWGLYNGRYGMSDKVLLDGLAAANRALADTMLAGELARQERLKASLRADPATAPWVEDAHLFQNYKQLQFFDTLALYFHCVPEGRRAPSTFSHVPLDATRDATVAVEPRGDGIYAFDPYPFDRDGLALSFEGRYCLPADADESLRRQLERSPVATQQVRLVAA